MNTTADPNRLLEVKDLSVSTLTGNRRNELIHEVSFVVRRSEVLVFLGESGSGKSILSRSLTKLFPVTSPLRIDGSVTFEGQHVLDLSRDSLALLRRHKIRYIFQDPMQSLNPLARVRTQLHLATDARSADDTILGEALSLAGLDNAREVLDLYPHQLSIGMAQRVCIAMAVLPAPSLLIADEPTSAVDASLTYRLLDVLMSIQQNRGMSVLLITHDLEVARSYGDRIVIMYGGRIIETAPRTAFFERQLHPYSRLLVDAQPAIGKPVTGSGTTIQSMTEDAAVSACRFHERCPIARDRCRESEPESERVPEEREVRCFYWK